jgi:hypothetical protein
LSLHRLQRRTGAPFVVGAYYPADVVTISGTSNEFTHAAASGGKIHNYFCPQCGSTVYWKLSNLPALIAVAVGTMAEPQYPAPVISVSNSRNMIGFKLMVPWSTSGKAASQKIRTETPPKNLVSRTLPTGGCANAGVAVACRSPVRWSERSLRCATAW